MSSSGQDLTNELYFRLGGRVPTTLLIDYINRAMSIVNGAASYAFNLLTAGPTITGGVLELSTFDPNIDIGANIEIANANGVPVQRATEEGLLQSQANQYTGINPNIFNNWTLRASGVAGSPGVIIFTPTIASLQVFIAYNRLPPVLVYAATPTVRWTQKWMDDLVVDFAEVETKRILNFGGWEELEKRSLAKLQDARTVFSAQRQDTGTIQESQVGQSGA